MTYSDRSRIADVGATDDHNYLISSENINEYHTSPSDHSHNKHWISSHSIHHDIYPSSHDTHTISHDTCTYDPDYGDGVCSVDTGGDTVGYDDGGYDDGGCD